MGPSPAARTRRGRSSRLCHGGAADPARGLTINGGRFDADANAQLGDAFPAVQRCRHPAGHCQCGTNLDLTAGALDAAASQLPLISSETVGFSAARGRRACGWHDPERRHHANEHHRRQPARLRSPTSPTAAHIPSRQNMAWNGGTNASSGRLTVNGAVDANDFVGDGL